VTSEVAARGIRADSVGNETEVRMNDPGRNSVFAPGGDNGGGQHFYLKQHRIRSGKQTISVTVPQEPGRVALISTASGPDGSGTATSSRSREMRCDTK
jgi:hypothetical protein